jgi:hypothetical protein
MRIDGKIAFPLALSLCIKPIGDKEKGDKRFSLRKHCRFAL